MASWPQIELSGNTETDNLIKEKMTLFLRVFSLISTFMSKETKDYTFQIIVQHYREWVGRGNGNPLQCSCLENPRDGGAWWAVVNEVAESDTTEAT